MQGMAPPLGHYSAILNMNGTLVTVTNRVQVKLEKLALSSLPPRQSRRPAARAQREKCVVSDLDAEEIYWNT